MGLWVNISSILYICLGFSSFVGTPTIGAAAPPTAVDSPALPEGIGFATVFRVKRTSEVFTAAGLPPDAGKKIGLSRLLGGFEDNPDDIVTVAVAFSKGFSRGTFWQLVTLARPYTLQEFISRTGNDPHLTSGDEKQRKLQWTSAGRTNVLIYQQLTPQEYFLTESDGADEQAGPANPAELLSGLRTSVAGGGHLAWLGSARFALIPGMLAPSNAPPQFVENLTMSLSWTDDLKVHVEGRFASEQAAADAAARMKILLPPMPELPPAATGVAPVQSVRVNARLATCDLVFPKHISAMAARLMLDGIEKGMNKSKAVRYADLIVDTFNAASAAGCQKLQNTQSVWAIVSLLEAGTSPETGPFQKSNFKIRLESDAFRKEVCALLEYEKGRLQLTANGAAAAANEKKTDTMIPSDHALSIRKAKKDALALSTAFLSAKAAGSKEASAAQSLDEAMNLVRTGVSGAGKFSGTTFILRLSKTEVECARPFLAWNNGELRYTGGDDF